MRLLEKYRAFGLQNFREIPQVREYLSEEEQFEIQVVGQVLPFKTNNYVVEQLIRWDQVPHDPIFKLTFPQRQMLTPNHFGQMADAVRAGASKAEIKVLADKIRMALNPHPAGQMTHNVPELDGIKLTGIQHKYRETMLFFPQQGQTCHAYCTFCFRWPQFVGLHELKFAMKEKDLMVQYLKRHPEITDVLFTGGDPMIMRAKHLRGYFEPIIREVPTVKNIRIGSKALGYWPQRFLTDPDVEDVLKLFEEIISSGIHLSFMAHFNHIHEMQTDAVKAAIKCLRDIGVEIRTQSPIMRHINDRPDIWRDMWREQVKLGCVPYYMFIARDTGAQEYFAVSLERAWNVFRHAYQQVSGLARTVRGPSMSAGPGKVQILGVSEVSGEKVFTLRFLQGRNPDWVHRPFFAMYDPDAIWLSDLKPAFGKKKFFFEKTLPVEVAN